MPPSKKSRQVREDAPVKKPSLEKPDDRLVRLRELVKILEGSTLAELSYEDADIAVSLQRNGAPKSRPGPDFANLEALMAASSGSAAPAAPPAPALSIAPPPAPVDEADVVVMRSPFVGTFYSSPRPGTPVFCEVGSRVRRGQTVCIIEAMKLMNEIEAEVDGVVLGILADNGKPVQYGDPLLKLKKG